MSQFVANFIYSSIKYYEPYSDFGQSSLSDENKIFELLRCFSCIATGLTVNLR